MASGRCSVTRRCKVGSLAEPRLFQRVLAVAAQVFARQCPRQLHSRLPLVVREVAEQADRGNGDTGEHQHDDDDVGQRQPDAERRLLRIELQLEQELLQAGGHGATFLRR